MIMKKLFSQLLIALCGILLVLPPGWCCHLQVSPCRPTAGVATHEVQQAAIPLSECCCCSTPDSTEGNSKAPTDKPAPVKKSCCESTPVIMPEKERVKEQDFLSIPVSLIMGNDWIVVHKLPCGTPVFDWSPPLHLLHCVWLC